MERKGFLLVFALVCFLVLVSSQAVAQADAVPNATSALNVPDPLTPDSSAAITPTWVLVALVVFLVAVYIALLVLVVKYPPLANKDKIH